MVRRVFIDKIEDLKYFNFKKDIEYKSIVERTLEFSNIFFFFDENYSYIDRCPDNCDYCYSSSGKNPCELSDSKLIELSDIKKEFRMKKLKKIIELI